MNGSMTFEVVAPGLQIRAGRFFGQGDTRGMSFSTEAKHPQGTFKTTVFYRL